MNILQGLTRNRAVLVAGALTGCWGWAMDAEVAFYQTREWVLRQQGYRLDTILRPGEVGYLHNTAKLSTRGMAMACTGIIHPQNRWLCEQAARWVGLDLAGIDLVIPDIPQPLRQVAGVVGWVAAMAQQVLRVILATTWAMQTALNQGKARDLLVIFLEQVSRTLCLVPEAQRR